LPKWGISGQNLSAYHKSTIEAETLMIPLMPPFWQTPVISSLSFSRILKLKQMHTQDLINEAAKKFIKELDGKEFTVAHFRKIIFGSCANLLKSSSKEQILLDFVRHPSVQLRGVGMNGNVMDKFIQEAKSEKEMWRNELVKEILSESV
jgi:hypothetical protein